MKRDKTLLCTAQGMTGLLLFFGSGYGNQQSWWRHPAAQGTACPRNAALDSLLEVQRAAQLPAVESQNADV